MIVTRIFTGGDGKARIERREVPMQPDRSGRATSADLPALRQFILVVSGSGEIELDDGTRHRFAPGALLFAEDTSGDGHITRTLEGTRGFAHIPVGPAFDITRWPLA